jgi:hypothetical protein
MYLLEEWFRHCSDNDVLVYFLRDVPCWLELIYWASNTLSPKLNLSELLWYILDQHHMLINLDPSRYMQHRVAYQAANDVESSCMPMSQSATNAATML